MEEFEQSIRDSGMTRRVDKQPAASTATSTVTETSDEQKRKPKPACKSGEWTKEEVLALCPSVESLLVSREQTWHSRWRVEFRGWAARNRNSVSFRKRVSKLEAVKALVRWSWD
eukprot:5965862-Amphidinium_carterae.1